MAVDTSFASLFENLKLEDPWLPPKPWESIPSESGLSHSTNSSSYSRCIYDTSTVSEDSLVRLAMNALQGLESALISIEKLCASFFSEPADRTFHRVQSLWSRTSSTHALGNILKSIGDSGRVVFLLYKFVDYLTNLTPQENEEANIEKKEKQIHPSHSLVNQAFGVAVKRILEGYNASMDTLYTSVGLRRSSTNNEGSLGVGVGCLMSIDYSQVTLLEVYLHSKGLRTQIASLGNVCHVYYVALCSSVASLEAISLDERFSKFPRGGDLLTYLYTQLKVSDPVHCALLKFLFLQSFEPYCEFIRSWIYKAKISDPYNEFIVNCVDILQPNSVGNSNIGISVDFPPSTVTVRDGVAVPCFLKEFLIPLFRAGQQLQVLMKLLELSDSSGTWNRTYEDFLPYWNGLASDSRCHTSPLTFSKEGIETIVLARNGYYKRMMDKLEDLPAELDFRYQKVVPHGLPVFTNYNGKRENLPPARAISDTSMLPATEKREQESLAAVENSEACSMTDEFSYVEDPWDSSECSSIYSPEEENQPENQIELPHNMIVPDQKYFSALSFCSSISTNTSLQKPLKSDNSFTPYFADPKFSSISETQAHRLLQNSLDIDCDATATAKDQYPIENFDSSVSAESWNCKYNSDILSTNPIVNKNYLVHLTNKLGETSFTEYRNNVAFLDFTIVKDPFVACLDKSASKPKYQNGTSHSVVTEPTVGKEDYSCDKVPADNTKSYVYSPLKSKVDHKKNVSLTTSLCGGNSWESLLGNSNNTADIKNKDQGNSLAVILDIPLDFVMGKCLLEEIMLQYRYLSKLTIKLLEEGFSLREHLLALRRYHFMELADWADLFVMNLWNNKLCIAEADRRISEIQSFLELSLQRSSCERDNHKDRLFVYMKKQSLVTLSASLAGIHSFDCIGLGYRVDWPISIVLTPAALKMYGDIFSFLIQVKLGLSSLAEVWCSLKELKHVMSQDRHSELHASEVYHFNVLMRLRQQVNHFVATLQQYVHSQLSHVCWSKFQHSLKHKVKDMMDLESVHMAYLTDSLQVCFLSDETRFIASFVQCILQCALDFRYCLIGRNFEAGLDRGGLQGKLSRINISQVLTIKNTFGKNIKELYQCYHKSPRHVEFGLSGFWDYLNYNGYYSDII